MNLSNNLPITSEARITDLIYFHGVTLPVITFENTSYIPAKPLVTLANIDWSRAKRTLISPSNTVLYCTKVIKVPSITAQGGLMATLEDVLCIRLDRSRMFIARINTDRMSANGNIEAAEKLLALQVEWAGVLHDYETKGIAVKDKTNTNNNEIIQIQRMQKMAIGAAEKEAFNRMLHDKMTEVGYSIIDPQHQLF